jgi:Haem-NO-binding
MSSSMRRVVGVLFAEVPNELSVVLDSDAFGQHFWRKLPLGRGFMHGLIFVELKKFVVAGFGADAWRDLIGKTGEEHRIYLPSRAYPDAEMLALVAAACALSGKKADDLLEAFGAFIVPDLVGMYRAHIDRKWSALDLIENTEVTMHRVVRRVNRGAAPPVLKVRRMGSSEVIITYTSERKLCALAKGIVRGIAKHYEERVTIEESSCMLRGADVCSIAVHAGDL